MSNNYMNFVFYGSWRDTLEGFREDFGDEYAKEALWNLMLMATAGDVETEKKSILGFVKGACMPNVVAAQERYVKAQEDGQKGGRPKLLSDINDAAIAAMRASGQKQTEIAKTFGVSDKTISRSDGWRNWKNYVTGQNQTKPDTKTQNPDIDIDIDTDIEKDIQKDNSDSIQEEEKQSSSIKKPENEHYLRKMKEFGFLA